MEGASERGKEEGRTTLNALADEVKRMRRRRRMLKGALLEDMRGTAAGGVVLVR
mgnify:CR=1 FL=1